MQIVLLSTSKLLLALQTIITLGSLTHVSIKLTFSRKTSYSNFSFLAKSVANIIDETITLARLLLLSKPSNCIEFYNKLILFLKDILFNLL